MKKLVILSLIMISFLSLEAKQNPYHTRGTKEYKEVTSKLLGLWNISSYTIKGDEKIGTTYPNATVEIKGTNELTAVFRFTLPRDVIEQRIHAWNKKGATVSVDSYVVVGTYEFKIHKKGVLVYLDNPKTTVEITGSGEQLDNFRAIEKLYIEKQSSMKDGGGLTGMLGAKLMQEVTNTDFVPKIPSQVNYKNLADNSVDMVSIGKKDFKLTKD